MSPDSTGMLGQLIGAFALPNSCRVDQRVPKKLLLEHGATSSGDKRLISDGVDTIQWIAALKPNTIGIAPYRDEQRDYLEVSILTVALRTVEGKPAKATRLAELVHRAVPYPLVLIITEGARVMLSLAHKRLAQNEAGKFVLDGNIVAVVLPDDAPSSAVCDAFIDALPLSAQPLSTLLELYSSWVNRLEALLAARVTGTFRLPDNTEWAAVRRAALAEFSRLEPEMVRLRALAAKERQVARQVELNLALQTLKTQLVALKEQL